MVGGGVGQKTPAGRPSRLRINRRYQKLKTRGSCGHGAQQCCARTRSATNV